MQLPFRRFKIAEESMLPALAPGSQIITESLFLTIKPPAVGEILVVEHAGLHQVKRVVSVLGEELLLAGDNRARSAAPFTVGRHQIIGRVFYQLTTEN